MNEPFERAEKVEAMIPDILRKYLKILYDKGYQQQSEQFALLLAKARIVCLWRNKERMRDGKTVLGSLSTISERMQAFIQGDYLLEICSKSWAGLSELSREYLLFHELLHGHVIERDDKETGGVRYSFGTKNHDYQGFVSEFYIAGNWRGDLPMDSAEDVSEK